MKRPKNDNHSELEQLRMENELKKMKLMLEYGANFWEPSGKKPIDPSMENEFLANIEAFEKNYRQSETILLYDFIKKPDYMAVHAISDDRISAELERIMKILNQNGIHLDTNCPVEERELYRFITEELFVHEMDNMRIEGMMNCFIYEEFHPNHENDIRNLCNDGIKSYLNKETDYYTNHFTKEAKESAWYNDFRDAFESFSLHHFQITNLNMNGITASVTFNIAFSGIMEGSSEKQHFKGEGSVELLSHYDYWSIQIINFPTPSKVL